MVTRPALLASDRALDEPPHQQRFHTIRKICVNFYLLFQAPGKNLAANRLSYHGLFGLDPHTPTGKAAGNIRNDLASRVGDKPDQLVRVKLCTRSGAQTVAGRNQALVCIWSVKLPTALRQNLHLFRVLVVTVTAQTSAEASEEASCVSVSRCPGPIHLP